MPHDARIRKQNADRFRRLLAGQLSDEDRVALTKLLAEQDEPSAKAPLTPPPEPAGG